MILMRCFVFMGGIQFDILVLIPYRIFLCFRSEGDVWE
jgi:hypothetical protein